MSSQPDFIRKKFGPLRDKTLRNALAHRIAKEFPRIGGPRICQLCADMILEVVFKHMRPHDHVKHGQVLWMAVSVNDPPGHRQRIADTELVPVLLDLSTADDVQLRIDRLPAPNGCCTRPSACASRPTSRGDCSPTATSPSCSTPTTVEIASCWPSTSAPPTRSSRDVPRFTMSDRDSLISALFAGSDTPKARSRTSSLARPTTASKPLTVISGNTIASATAASRGSRLSKPLTPWPAACVWCDSTSTIDDLLEKKRA